MERGQREREEILVRLRRVEGQLRGIQHMIEQERTCEDVITQLMAARAALDRASLVIMSHQIEYCLSDASGEASRAQLQRLIELFLRFAGPLPPEAPNAAIIDAESISPTAPEQEPTP
jgi:CsoR family transcriptional regulator, copper-sensing transcriptional repressor